jgi:hypothetical protein
MMEGIEVLHTRRLRYKRKSHDLCPERPKLRQEPASDRIKIPQIYVGFAFFRVAKVGPVCTLIIAND